MHNPLVRLPRLLQPPALFRHCCRGYHTHHPEGVPNHHFMLAVETPGCGGMRCHGKVSGPGVWEADEPTEAQRRELAVALSAKYGVSIDVPPVPSSADLDLRPPRISIPCIPWHPSVPPTPTTGQSTPMAATSKTASGPSTCSSPNPPDVVAYPATMKTTW